MVHENMSAADYINILEQLFNSGKVTVSDRKKALEDMSTMLNEAYNAGDTAATFNFVSIGQHFMISTKSYRRFYFKNHVISETWYKDGKEHREGGKPAVITYHEGSSYKSSEAWHNEGDWFRGGDKPTFVSYHANGNVDSEAWYQEGNKPHREGDKPAEVYYYENGNVCKEEWRLEGKLSREPGKPVEIEYFHNGQIQSELFYDETRPAGYHGPRAIIYRENGQILEEI